MATGIHRRILYTLWVVACLGSVALVSFVQARPPPEREQYTYEEGKGCKKGDRVDPINVVFQGRRADSGNAIRATTKATGMGETKIDSPQQFVWRGRCRNEAGETASATALESRFHVRYFGFTSGKKAETRAGAHHEDVACAPPKGHAVDKGTKGNPTPNGSGFDQGREELRKKFRRKRYKTRRTRWGNTQSFPQCDKDRAGSDGRVLVVTLNKRIR